MTHNITVEGGTSVRLPTAGKYCDMDIIVTATGGSSGDLSVESAIIDRTITEYRNDTLVKVGAYSFYNCAKMTSAYFPNVTTIEQNGFRGCTVLAELYVPKVETLGEYALYTCRGLKKLNLPSISSIGNYSMRNCSELETVILRGDTIATLSSTNAIAGTLIESGNGYIYVPSALLDTYKVATNWSTYADKLRAIEDYPEITGE